MSALMGTGLVTLGVALSGVAGLSDDLRAATRQATPATPLLSPQDETATPSRTTPASTPSTRSLDVDCPDAHSRRDT